MVKLLCVSKSALGNSKQLRGPCPAAACTPEGLVAMLDL